MASGAYVDTLVNDLIALHANQKAYVATLIECISLLNQRVVALEDRLEQLSDAVYDRTADDE